MKYEDYEKKRLGISEYYIMTLYRCGPCYIYIITLYRCGHVWGM